ncbi:MAG: anti-sigma factor family protein [Mycobacteriales bacterium]
MSEHLGEQAAAFVDGELGHEARDRALGHLLGCQVCRDEVAAQRAVKQALGGLDVPAPPGALQDLLRELGCVPAGFRVGAVPTDRPSLVRPIPRRGRRRRVMAGCALAGCVGVSGLLALGGPAASRPGRPSGPQVDPASVLYVDQHAATTGDLPFDYPVVPAVGVRTAR